MPDAKDSGIISRKPFDLQEAVVLLDVFLSAKKKNVTNKQAAEDASAKLRALAERRGMLIDDAFRSSVGLQNRLRSIGNIYEGHESASAPGTQIFREAVALYKNDRKKFQSLLDESGVASVSVPRGKRKRKRIEKTKFVRTRKDQTLKEKYGAAFSSVYYALKSGAKSDESGATATELFSALGKSIKRKDIATILDAASWSKKVSDTHYLFFDKEQEERKQKQMEESLKTAEQDFFAWLPSALSPSAIEEVKSSYKTVSAMLVQRKILPQALFATTQIGQVENALRLSKRVFGGKKLRGNAVKLLSAYISFLRDKKNTVSIKEPQVEIKENWIHFDFSNAQGFERTVPAYCSIDGDELTGRNWARILVGIAEKEIERKNPQLDVLYKQPLLANRKDRPFFLKEKIDGLNCTELSNGYWLNVNYSIPRLMEQIRALCLHCGYNKSQVAIYGIPKDERPAKTDNPVVPKTTGNGVPIEKAEEFLKSAELKGATIQELIDGVQPGAAVSPTRIALEASTRVIEMPGNRYVHEDAFIDLDEAEDDMKRILKTHFAQFGGYSNNKLLFGAASHDLSMFLNDNDCEDIDSVYALAQFFFGKKNNSEGFTFSYPHIFEGKPDYPLTLKGLMINYARHNGGMLDAEEAKDYLGKTMLSYGSIGQLLQVYSDSTFLMYDESHYILTDTIGIDDAWIGDMHDKLDNLFRQADVAFVIPRDISLAWFDTLPALPLGMRWTMLLLQEVIRKFPAIGFKAVKSGLDQPYDTIAAAFVPEGSPVQSFPDVVSLYMQEHFQLPKKMTCEDLRVELREAGMLEGNEMIYSLYRALDDYRFAWTDENKTVLVRGN